MKVAFEPRQGLVITQISTVKEESSLDALHLPDHVKRDLELKKEGITFTIKATHPHNDYKVGDEVYINIDPKQVLRINLNTSEGSQEFLMFTEDAIIGRKVSVEEEA